MRSALSPLLRPRVLLAATLLCVAAALLTHGSPRAAASQPQPQARASRPEAARPDGFQRACGSIAVRGRRLRVDVAEGDGTLVTCDQARRIGRRFLHDGRDRFRLAGHVWDCYTARADGVGWAHHCLRMAAGDRYVDVGIGRRW